MNSHGMHETGGEPYFYSNYTWKELRAVPAQRRVVLLPVGSTEDHGHHLPLDTDNFMAWTVCVETAKRVPDEVLVMPLIPYGYNLHHVDFPGTICVGAEHFINYVADVCKSIAYHGFKRILIVDGHGSNVPLLDVAARRVILETDALCASFGWTWWTGRRSR
jgi:creatinine amidohydrolase